MATTRWFDRIALGAAQVVADLLANVDPWLTPAIDWDATIAFRHATVDCKRFVGGVCHFIGERGGTASLSNEPMKDTGENAAWMNLVERLAVSLRIDAPGHFFPCFIANQADRKVVGALAGNDSGTLDPPHDEGSRRPDWI
jgi:hypothetical protein